MAKAGQTTQSRSTRTSAGYKTRSRARIAKMVKSGRAAESFNEVARMLGIELASGERPRLVTVYGHKVG
jgi:hypothetical protein